MSAEPGASAVAPVSPSGPESPGGDPRTKPSRFDVWFASIWLVFLVTPAIRLWSGDAGPGATALGWIGLVAFLVMYVFCWARPGAMLGLGQVASVFARFVGLVMCALAMVPAIGLGALSVTPYLIALVVFQLPVRLALTSAAAVAAAAGLLTWLIDSSAWVWVVPMTLTALFVMVLILFTAEREERAYAIAHELDMSRQREQLARDVHDLLGHSLTVVAVKTELARRLLDRDPERARAELDDVLALTRESLTQVRSTVGRLRSPVWFAQLASARTALEAAGIQAKLPSDPDAVPPDEQEVFAWCLREAVTNVVRHSGATRCAVTAAPGLLTVTDDGVGVGADPLNDSAGAAVGNGIAGMRERVGEHGGRLSIGPAPGAELTADARRSGRPGTRVEVRL